jgi:UDP-glucose 4-epimerase
MIQAFELASGREVPFRIAPRRLGDIATCFADPSKAESDLGWKASLGLTQMMEDAWRWQQQNPNGFR